MEASYYWLISITTESISVALIQRGSPDVLLSLGPETAWQLDSSDSFLHAVDISLSAAAEKAAFPPESEPETSAFILPPKWIGNDGKIYPEHLKLLESLCRSLKLKPLGFISNDEAFIESLHQSDSFPPSFILVSIGQKEFSLSLVYLGEVKKRFHQNLDGDFTPQDLESALVTVRLDSALPPRIILFGHLSPTLVDDLKNYPWIGKKNVETFLHLPDVEVYPPEKLFSLYCQTVSSQLENPASLPSSPPIPEPATPVETPESLLESDMDDESPQPSLEPLDPLTPEIDAQELGFTEITDSDSLVMPPPPVTASPSPKAKIKLPSLHLPHLHLPALHWPSFHFNPLFLIPLGLSPLLILLPYFLIKADVTINFNPIEINHDFNLTLDSTATAPSSTVIPVSKKTFNLSFTESVPATGQKETGDKSKGEVTVYNKLDKIQNIPKGNILTDPTGKKYELLTSIQAPPSTYDLATGTITMGQIKANIIAADIGPEFNQNKDTVFSFKDNADLIAKSNDSITGGSRRQVQTIAAADKTKLSQQVATSLQDQITQKSQSEANSGLLPDTANIDQQHLEYNREVGEEADTLSVKVDAVLSLFQIDSSQKDSIIKTLLSQDESFSQSLASASDFSFSFKSAKTDSQKSTGTLTITGRSLPKIDIDALRLKLAGQSFSQAKKIIVSQPRVYNYQLNISPSFFSFLNRLPPKADKITILQKF